MSFVSECPSCGQKLKVPDNLEGKKVRCSKCAGTFVAENPANPPAPPSPIRASRRDEAPEERYDDRRDDRRDDEEEDHPRRRSRRGSSSGGRGGMLLTFGIISIASPLLAIVVHVVAGFVFPPLIFCSLLFVIIGLVLGIMAWVMGGGDLKKIRAGRIDSA